MNHPGNNFSRRTFIKTLLPLFASIFGPISCMKSRLDYLLVGDSMMHFWRWSEPHVKISAPGATVVDLERMCEEYIHSQETKKAGKTKTILLWAGTADCVAPLDCILPNGSIDTNRYLDTIHRKSIDEIEKLIHTEEKMRQVLDDTIKLAEYVKNHFPHDAFKIIGPFPHRHYYPEDENTSPHNFKLVDSLSKHLSKEFGEKYIDLRKYFLDLDEENVLRDKEKFFYDNVHMNAEGYRFARGILRDVYNIA